MNLQPMFERLASMAGVHSPEAGARMLRERLDRDPDRADAQAETTKWFLFYRRREIPGSIAAYMAAVEAAFRNGASR